MDVPVFDEKLQRQVLLLFKQYLDEAARILSEDKQDAELYLHGEIAAHRLAMQVLFEQALPYMKGDPIKVREQMRLKVDQLCLHYSQNQQQKPL